MEKKEYVFLKRLLNVSGYYKDINTQESLKKLSAEIAHALICDNDEMPKDVIRFNSIITVTSGAWQSQFQLVIPTERDISKNKVSILAPMGSAVMGYAEGDTVTWNFPNGTKELFIAKVEQAEYPVDMDVAL
tara:strand:- start:267240 stop:267635 length:396 start_codon:yes stop_codon:yes gene_type:complete